jgi:hypothetical protein
MKKILVLYDYCYYRITGFYKQLWPNWTPENTGRTAVAALQFITLVVIVFGINILLGDKIIQYFLPHVNLIKPIFLSIAILILLHSHYRYRRIITYEKLEEKWRNEDIYGKKLNGIYVFLYHIILLLLVIAFAIYRHFHVIKMN